MWLIACLLALLWAGSANAACTDVEQPPAAAAAEGLTYRAYCGDFTDNSQIDVNDTQNPGYLLYTHNAWPNAGFYNCGQFNNVNNLCFNNLVPTLSADYSTGAGGLNLTPRAAKTTGNNTLGASTITGISVVSGTLPTTGTILVYGPGIQNDTSATISGTTATLSRTTTSGSTGGTYYFQSVYNGSMFSTAAYSSTDPRGWVGTTFDPPFYAEMTFTLGTETAQWTTYESWPSFGFFPMSMFNYKGLYTNGTVVHVCEIDMYESPYGISLHTDTFNGDGAQYYSGNQLAGNTDYTANTTAYTAPAGVSQTVGLVHTNSYLDYIVNGTSQMKLNYGSGLIPTITGSGTWSPGTPPASALDGGVGHCDTETNEVFYFDASPNWPMTNISIRIWTKPKSTTIAVH